MWAKSAKARVRPSKPQLLAGSMHMEERALFDRFVWRGVNIECHNLSFPRFRINPTLKRDSTTGKFCFTWLRVTFNMKNSSHKTWQTSHLVLNPLQIQTLREYYSNYIIFPICKKVRGHAPCPPPNCAHDLDVLFSLSSVTFCLSICIHIVTT